MVVDDVVFLNDDAVVESDRSSIRDELLRDELHRPALPLLRPGP